MVREKPAICVDGRSTHPRKYFKNPEEALAYAQELAEYRQNPVEEPLLFSSRLRVIAAEGEKALRDKGGSVKEAISHYHKHLEEIEKAGPGMTMGEAFVHYMAARLREYNDGQISKVTYDGSKHRLKRDQGYFNKVLVKTLPRRLSWPISSAEQSTLPPEGTTKPGSAISSITAACKDGWNRIVANFL